MCIRDSGRGIALALAKEGYQLAINYNGSEEAAKETAALCEEQGVKARIYRCNVADHAAVEAKMCIRDRRHPSRLWLSERKPAVRSTDTAVQSDLYRSQPGRHRKARQQGPCPSDDAGGRSAGHSRQQADRAKRRGSTVAGRDDHLSADHQGGQRRRWQRYADLSLIHI